MLFSRYSSVEWIEEYKEALRNNEWQLPWDDAMHMLFYTLIQERATQINYLNAAAIAAGKVNTPEHRNDADPVLEKVCITIATDEAAHYNFFNESARLMFYYYRPVDRRPGDVIKHFSCPAWTLFRISALSGECAQAAVFGPREYAGDVLQVALSNINVRASKAFSYGVRRSRAVPDPDGNLRDTALFEAIDYPALEKAVKRLHDRIAEHEREIGYSEVDPTYFVPSGLSPEIV